VVEALRNVIHPTEELVSGEVERRGPGARSGTRIAVFEYLGVARVKHLCQTIRAVFGRLE